MYGKGTQQRPFLLWSYLPSFGSKSLYIDTQDSHGIRHGLGVRIVARPSPITEA